MTGRSSSSSSISAQTLSAWASAEYAAAGSRVAVRAAEAAQVGHDDVGLAGEQVGDVALVVARARPPVQEDDRGAGAGAVVLEGEAVDGPAAGHRRRAGRGPVPRARTARARPCASRRSQHVAFLDVLVVREHDAALEAGGDLAHVVVEALSESIVVS